MWLIKKTFTSLTKNPASISIVYSILSIFLGSIIFALTVKITIRALIAPLITVVLIFTEPHYSIWALFTFIFITSIFFIFQKNQYLNEMILKQKNRKIIMVIITTIMASVFMYLSIYFEK